MSWNRLSIACCLLAGCMHTAAEPDEPSVEVSGLPTDWIEHANPEFSFHGPPDLRTTPVDGIDSFVGELESTSFRIHFDHGWYSDDSFAGHIHDPKQQVEQVVIDGRPARLAFYEDRKRSEQRPFVYAAYVPDVNRTGEKAGEVKLSFDVQFADAALRDAARAILMSIRFREGTER